ncbi:MAG: DUF2256 domain-containing protein [Myxococcota bacterium]|nr:DUF2256 domain-containing protein [Myxococcota bacterium]
MSKRTSRTGRGSARRRPFPDKICPVCLKPFSWRKKWERDWQNVRYCSERCRRSGRGA